MCKHFEPRHNYCHCIKLPTGGDGGELVIQVDNNGVGHMWKIVPFTNFKKLHATDLLILE